MKLSSVLATVLLALVALPAVAGADPRPASAPGPIRIESISYEGSGCPAGSASADVSPDGNAFTVLFSDFLVQQGPDIPREDANRTCTVTLSLAVPAGYTYAVTAVDYRGYANIAPGSVGYHKGMYHFTGQQPLRSEWRPFTGALDEDWHVREVVETPVWGKCRAERKLQIKAQLRLERGSAARDASSFMTIDSQDGEVEQVYHLAWAPCSRNGR